MLCQNRKEVLKNDGTTTVIEDGLLCKKALTDEAIQTVVPECYKRTILFHGLCSTFAGHPETRKMYAVRRRTYYWLFMASNVHEFLFKWELCRQHRPSQKYRRRLLLFPPRNAIEFAAFNILGPLEKAKEGNRFIVLMTDRCSKLTRAIPVPKITASHTAVVFLEN